MTEAGQTAILLCEGSLCNKGVDAKQIEADLCKKVRAASPGDKSVQAGVTARLVENDAYRVHYDVPSDSNSMWRCSICGNRRRWGGEYIISARMTFEAARMQAG